MRGRIGALFDRDETIAITDSAEGGISKCPIGICQPCAHRTVERIERRALIVGQRLGSRQQQPTFGVLGRTFRQLFGPASGLAKVSGDDGGADCSFRITGWSRLNVWLR